MAKRKTIRAIFENIDSLTSEDISKSQQLKELLMSQVPISIYESHSARKQYATIFEINSTDHYIEIPKRDWVTALETCIMWFLEIEEYEKCTKLKQIIEEIQKKSIKKLNVKSDE